MAIALATIAAFGTLAVIGLAAPARVASGVLDLDETATLGLFLTLALAILLALL